MLRKDYSIYVMPDEIAGGVRDILETLKITAPVYSPVFTGVPQVPSKTSAAGYNPTLIATEMQVALKANIESPVFTGVPQVPSKTSAAGYNPTLIATEAQVYNLKQSLLELTDPVYESLLDRFYPIGAIYESVSDQSPAEFMGGTWTVWGSGRVSVGVDTAQAEFNAVEKTGGAKAHTLAATEIAAHTHSTPNHIHPNTSHYHTFLRDDGVGYGLSNTFGIGDGDGIGGNQNTNTVTIATPSGGASTSGSAGGGGAHNNLQPYITSYKYKRTG